MRNMVSFFALLLLPFAIGCTDPEVAGKETGELYVEPLHAVQGFTKCEEPVAAARSRLEQQSERLRAQRLKVQKVKGDSRFQESMRQAADTKLSAPDANDYVRICLKESRELGKILQETAAALGVDDIVEPWPKAPPSRGVHRCVYRGTCEEYVGSDHTESIKRDVCERVEGKWAEGGCARRGAAGICRYEVGTSYERSLITYGGASAEALRLACERPETGSSPGTWEPLTIDVPAASGAPSSAAMAEPKRVQATTPKPTNQGSSASKRPAPSRPAPPPRPESGF